jgi:hypothetical protein
MRDRIIEGRISELHGLIGQWDSFHQTVSAVGKGAPFTDEHEREFLEAKSSIAREFQAIADKFAVRTFPDEELTSVLSEAVSLEQVSKMAGFSVQNLENTWHRVYIALNKIVGHLESDRDSLARINLLSFKGRRFLKNKLFIFLLVAGIVSGGLFMGYKYYSGSLRHAIEQVEMEERGEEVELGDEAAQTDIELVRLIRDLRGLVVLIRGKMQGESADRWCFLAIGILGGLLAGWGITRRRGR